MMDKAGISVSAIRRMELVDCQSGFLSGEHALDSFYSRHAWSNGRRGLGVTYVVPRSASGSAQMPPILGFYTISMAAIASTQAAKVLKGLPGYPIPAQP